MGKFERLQRGLGRYTAVYERDDASGAWTVEVREAPICHTWGRTLPQARDRIREALGLLFEDAETAEIADEVKLPKVVRAAYDDAKRKRAAAERARDEAEKSRERALKLMLTKGKLSQADIAVVWGVTKQRVATMTRAEFSTRGRKKSARKKVAKRGGSKR